MEQLNAGLTTVNLAKLSPSVHFLYMQINFRNANKLCLSKKNSLSSCGALEGKLFH